jgi:hypothetical protein
LTGVATVAVAASSGGGLSEGGSELFIDFESAVSPATVVLVLVLVLVLGLSVVSRTRTRTISD